MSMGQSPKVAVVKDERYLDHKPGHIHPEHPNRLRSIYRMLDKDFQESLMTLEPAPATLEHLELVHTPAYVKKVLKTAEHGFTSLAPDTPASSKTYLASWLAVGGCLKGLDALMSGQCDTCFALIRPPGHHALPDRAGGFCIFNNAGIAARYAAKKHERRRILIIDWDVHHGNGLNNLFYGEREVLYFSTHDPLLYPYTGDWKETGKGDGKGYTVNIPIPRELDDRTFLYLYKEILGPLFRRYKPDLVLVDAGFDGIRDDPVGRSSLSISVFGRLTRMILDFMEQLGNSPLLLVLEGGYNARNLTLSVKEVLKALTGACSEEQRPLEETPQALKLVQKAKKIHAKFGVWVD